VQHVSDDQPNDPGLIGVHPGLGPLPGEPVIQKRFGSAFFKTELERTLADLGVKTLYVCGLASFGCVNATVMCSVCKEHEAIVVKDAHGAREFADSTAAQVIDHFNAAWERAGAHLISAGEVSF
jgi:nicotinamidase-related amidase